MEKNIATLIVYGFYTNKVIKHYIKQDYTKLY